MPVQWPTKCEPSSIGLPESKPLSNITCLPYTPSPEKAGEITVSLWCFNDFSLLEFFYLQQVRNMALDDVVILNVDTNTLETPFDDLQSLPNDVVGSELMLWAPI